MICNRVTFFIVSIFIAVVCASPLAPLSVSVTHPGPDSVHEPLPTADEFDTGNRLIVLDRIVDGRYGVFLVGLDEMEVIVSLRPECADLLSQGRLPALEAASNRRARMEEKQNALRQRGSRFLGAE